MSDNQPKYRAYWLDGTGKFLSVDWVQADCDDEAIAAVLANLRSLKCEIWDGHRLVTKMNGHRPSASASPPSDEDRHSAT